MSGRGTITSRTTVSPKSMIEWMSARSCDSITSSSSAWSAMARSSCSDTNGPRFRPLPGRMTLVTPMRPRVITRIGSRPTTAATSGAERSAERSGCSIAHVLGAASANTKITAASITVATKSTPDPKCRSMSTATTDAITRWASSISSSTGLRKRSGCSTRRTNCFDQRRPSSSRAIAFARLMRVSAVSAMARNDATTVATTITTISQTSVGVMTGGSGRAARASRAP